MNKAIIPIGAAAAALLAGCATTGDTAGGNNAGGEQAAMACNADPAQGQVGQMASAATGAAILKASGARTLRWGPPNGAWTMDYREDRVNVRYDERMAIVAITCG